MPFKLIRDNIINVRADAIVNPTDCRFSGGGGADYVIHRAAGPGLNEVCSKLKPLEYLSAVVTPAFNLDNTDKIIHTFGPIYHDGKQGEEEDLALCYKNCLEAAMSAGCTSLAIPLISSGTFRFPKDRVLLIAMRAIGEFLVEHDLTVFLVVYDNKSYEISKKLTDDIKDYISIHCPDEPLHAEVSDSMLRSNMPDCVLYDEDIKFNRYSIRVEPEHNKNIAEKGDFSSVKKAVETKYKTESFADMLRRLIQEKGMTNADCYKRAYVSKSHFSKIMHGFDYNVGKNTVVSLAMGLGLDMEETQKLLLKAGYALSDCRLFDVVVRYFIENKKYDIMLANEVLYELDLPLLGAI